MSHMSNWELYAQVCFQRPETSFGTVYQALRNPYLDELINRDRRRLGVKTFNRKIGFEAVIALLREPGSVGILVDQSAGHSGIWMPFFNRLGSTSPLAATLAIRTNSAVVPAAIYTSGFARWRVVFEDEIPYDPSNPEQLTANINAVLERQIRRSPVDWFWVHNRWKTPWPHLLIARQKRGIYLPWGTDPSTFQTRFGARRRHGLQAFPAGWALVETFARCSSLRSSTSPRRRPSPNIRPIGIGTSRYAAALSNLHRSPLDRHRRDPMPSPGKRKFEA
jgi:hypothetical protein